MSARSQLVRARARRRAPERLGTLVALHADGADCTELVALCSAAAPELRPGRAAGAARARPVPRERRAGSRWRVRAATRGSAPTTRAAPSPRASATAWRSSRRWCSSCAERGGAPLYLLGRGTGATLALGAAQAFPELLAGVVALDGAPPGDPRLERALPDSRRASRRRRPSRSPAMGAAEAKKLIKTYFKRIATGEPEAPGAAGRRRHLVGAARLRHGRPVRGQGQGARADGQRRRPLRPELADGDRRPGDGRRGQHRLRAVRAQREDGEGPRLPQPLPLRVQAQAREDQRA